MTFQKKACEWRTGKSHLETSHGWGTSEAFSEHGNQKNNYARTSNPFGFLLCCQALSFDDSDNSIINLATDAYCSANKSGFQAYILFLLLFKNNLITHCWSEHVIEINSGQRQAAVFFVENSQPASFNLLLLKKRWVFLTLQEPVDLVCIK